MVIFKSKQNKFKGDLNIIEIKNYILLTDSKSVKYLEVEIHTDLSSNIMLIISPLN